MREDVVSICREDEVAGKEISDEYLAQERLGLPHTRLAVVYRFRGEPKTCLNTEWVNAPKLEALIYFRLKFASYSWGCSKSLHSDQ